VLGHRSILTAGALLALAVPAAASAATHTQTCSGPSASRCTATFALRGAKTGDRLVVRLPDTDLAIRRITPSPASLTQSYGFEGFSTRLGGSEFVAKLLILGAVPSGGRITFAFAVAPTMRSCGTSSDVQAHGVSCATAKRLANACVMGTGPGSAWTVFEVSGQVTLQRGGDRITFDPPHGGATCVPAG
jgi:hypothetical protein